MGGQYGDVIDQCIEDDFIVLDGGKGPERLEFPGWRTVTSGGSRSVSSGR